MGALLVGLDIALYMMNRLKVYMDYLQDLPAALERTNFESSLTELHALILQFTARAIRICQKNSLTRALDAFWKPDEVLSFETDCDKIEKRVEIEAKNCDRLLDKLERENTVRRTENLQKLHNDLNELQKMKDSIDRIEAGVSRLWNNSVEDKQAEILQWTSKVPYLDNHQTAREGRTNGTGDWIMHHPQYQEWITSGQSMILWLHGIRTSAISITDNEYTNSCLAGAGKTKLVANIIDQLSKRPYDEAVAYFYCNRNEPSRRDPANVLRSFVKQLSISRNEQAIQEILVEIYKEKQRIGFASAQLTLEEAESLLPNLMQAYSRTTLVLDALDECYEGSRSELIRIFGRLIKVSPQLKILVSSRRDRDIKFQLEKESNVGIEAADNHGDITKFVLAEIAQERPKPISDELREQIVKTLLDKSHGM